MTIAVEIRGEPSGEPTYATAIETPSAQTPSVQPPSTGPATTPTPSAAGTASQAGDDGGVPVGLILTMGGGVVLLAAAALMLRRRATR